jgi:hypothetical protein
VERGRRWRAERSWKGLAEMVRSREWCFASAAPPSGATPLLSASGGRRRAQAAHEKIHYGSDPWAPVPHSPRHRVYASAGPKYRAW